MSADTTLTVYGAGYLAGQSVQLVLCGVYAGDHTVATDGSVTFTYGTDPGGILTADYLIAHPTEGTDHDVAVVVVGSSGAESIVIPAYLGTAYTAKGQMIRPLGEAESGGPPGMGLGKMRHGPFASFLVKDLLALQVGTDLTNMQDVVITTDGGVSPDNVIAADSPYSGVLATQVNDAYGFDTQLAWSTNKPVTVIIGAAGIFVEGGPR